MNNSIIFYSIIGLFVILLFSVLIYLLKEKYLVAVLLNIAFLSIAVIEPAPSDIIFIFLLLFSIKGKRLQITKISKVVSLLFMLYCYIMINIVPFFDIIDYKESIKFFFITLYLILYAFFIFLYTSEENYILILRAYLLSSSFAAIIGILSHFGFLPELLMFGDFRVKALFKDPNVFGPFLVPSLIVLIDDLSQKKIILNKCTLHFFLIFLHIIGVTLSFSRGAWANLILTLLVYFALNFRKFNYFKLISYTVICIIFITLIWSVVLNDSFKDFLFERSRLQAYDMDRFAAQKAGIILMKNNLFLFGVGPGQYKYAVKRILGKNYSAHSLYIRVLLENGVLGFIFFITPVIYIFKKLLWKHFESKECSGLKSSVLIAILSGLMLSSVAIDTLHWRHFWLFLGLSMTAIIPPETKYN